MATILENRNDALVDNGPMLGDQTLTEGSSSWLWAVMAIFAVTFLAVAALSFRPRFNEKIFHYLFAIALLVGSISYFAQASGLAYSVIAQANQVGQGFTRQVYWARYVHWVVSFPAVTIALGLIAGVSWATIVYNVFLTWIWIISYLVGAYTSTNYKWGFFVFGTMAWLLLAAITLLEGRRAASRLGVGRDHILLAGWTNLLWFMYVLGWGLTDGGNRIGVVGASIWFGILDLLLVPGLAIGIVFLSRRWDYNALNLHFTQYGRVRRGADLPEKAAAPLGNGTRNGTVDPAVGNSTAGHDAVGHNAAGYNNNVPAHQAV